MSKQTIGYYKHFLVQPPTPAVEKINESTFTNFAKAWAHMGFLPVLREIGEYTFHVKLYLDALKIKDREELCMLIATYFRERIPELSSHDKCTQILVYARTWLTLEDISSADSLNDLEQSLLNVLPDETPFKCNEQGEGISHYLSNIPALFNHWNALALDGYFEPDYEERCRIEDEQKKKEELSGKTVSLTLFMKTGGAQPTTWDAKAINKYFQGNVAKRWAMLNGYLPTYTGYANGVIQFDLVTDPRCTGLYWNSLCSNIAVHYKQQIDFLKDATNFKVTHFIVNDIIGFNINAGDDEKFIKLNDRVQATYASIPKTSAFIHYGKIK